MRTTLEMMQIFVDFAGNDSRIRLAVLEGSRTNVNIAPDDYQDYDITYFVTDMNAYKSSDDWLDAFGKRSMMQKPEDMELFPSELGTWFSYIMLMEDGNKVDLTLIPVNEADRYFEECDGLVEILLDKDGISPPGLAATDRQYWLRQPTAREFDDCCNEFWMVSTYVAKGLARGELLFAIDHLNEVARPNLLRMMSWEIGAEHGYGFSVGKNYKFIDRYLPNEHWLILLSTYRLDDAESVRRSLHSCFDLFRSYSATQSRRFGYPYPNYDEVVSTYIERILQGR
ncbi:aminoglycoside adenylyltransferase [Paenibacillus sp. MY03]|uniref:aminoglycoside 6-adenylyltransferase n=1 Tax=Paenibacillus sp. MY03 TaxID=302980 RepID=UPI000B3CF3F9|nr:aminoglycoside 6-adenylyltransferase [Paenibacillus sp. MY03]OUS68465.1 aminoglycoside adenylyltransferase [Paenibacillus sp. MY03]